MERRIQKIIIGFAATALTTLFVPHRAFCQHVLQKDAIRIQIWSELEPLPGTFGDERFAPILPQSAVAASQTEIPDVENEKIIGFKNQSEAGTEEDFSPFGYAIRRAKEITPFLLAGMLDGWTFEYVPYDSTRRVSEYFTFDEVHPFDETVNTIVYTEPIVDDSRLLCWAECERTEQQKLAYMRWETIVNPKIKGHGTAPISAGFSGIQTACAAAIKDAVRAYWRDNIKNKPKEISGTVLLIQSPRIYIYEGQYVVDLDFFLKTDRIVLYSYY